MSDVNLSIHESTPSKTLIDCLRSVKPPQQDYALLASELNAAKEHFTNPLDMIMAEYFQIFANGYAFWDAAVNELWSDNGLSKAVNRATSLRNFIKMLLVTEGALSLGKPLDAPAAGVRKL